MDKISKVRVVVLFLLVVIGAYFINNCNTDDLKATHINECDNKINCIFKIDSAKIIPGSKLINKLNVHIWIDMSRRISPYWSKEDNDTSIFPYPINQLDSAYLMSISRSIQRFINSKKDRNVTIQMECFPPIEHQKPLCYNLKSESAYETICGFPNLLFKTYSQAYNSVTSSNEPDINFKFQQQLKPQDNYSGAAILKAIESKARDLNNNNSNNDSTIRNLLIIITDGELLQNVNVEAKGNKFTCLSFKKLKEKWGFNSDNWQEKIENDKYGLLIPEGSHLRNTEVILLGFRNYKEPWAARCIKKMWANLFFELQTKNFNLENIRDMQAIDLSNFDDFEHNPISKFILDK